ncbi:hypothetical protein Tco_1466137 [Tanacetum coccineum]
MLKILLNDLETKDVKIPKAEDNDLNIIEDTMSNKEFLVDLNLEFHDRALLANQKRFYKRARRVGVARKPMDKSNETCFDKESLSSGDEGTPTVKAFMAIVDDEPATSSKVSFDQLITKQIPGNIIHALGGRGIQKDSTSFKDAIFIKAEDSPIENSYECASDDEFANDNQEPLRALPKISRVEPIGTSKGITSAIHLTQTSTISEKTKQVSKKECDICGSIAHEPSDCDKKALPNNKRPRIASQQSKEPTKKYMTMVKQHLHIYSKKSGPKVVFGDNSAGDTEGYGLVNYNAITFTTVNYVNGLKHNLININQLCDANFKVLFIKTRGTIFNQNNEVVFIAPRRKYVYVIDIRQKLEETFHVTFNEADEAIRHTTNGRYEINFNENKSFPDEEGKAKLAWDSICKPKHKGCLGIRRLEDFNVALMATHIWCILTHKESLWVKWIHAYKLNVRDIVHSGFALSDSVSDLVANGNWRWQPDWITRF